MKVKIIKADDTNWYKEKIGEVFDVYRLPNRAACGLYDDDQGKYGYISLHDVEVVVPETLLEYLIRTGIAVEPSEEALQCIYIGFQNTPVHRARPKGRGKPW